MTNMYIDSKIVWEQYDIGYGTIYVIIDMFMIWYNVNQYVRDMLCDCYDTWYDMIWYGNDENCYVKYKSVMLWYMYAIWTKWYDWHAKRKTNMKYNFGIRMQNTINDMINDMRNDMGNDMIWISH